MLAVSAQRLTFLGDDRADHLAAQRVEIRNAGGGELVWRARATASWITLSPDRGLAPATLLVGIDARALQPGSHSGRIVIEAGGASQSPQSIAVSALIATTRPVAPPALQVSPDRVAFAAPVGQAGTLAFPVRLKAERDAGVRWTARSDKPWLTVTPPQGTTPATLTLTASPVSMPLGEQTATVVVHAVGRGPDLRIPVTFRVSAAAGGPFGFATTSLPAGVLNVRYSQALGLRGGRPPYTLRLAGALPPELALIEGVLRGTPRSPGVFAFTIIASDASDPPSTVTETLTLSVLIVDAQTALAVVPGRVQMKGTREQAPEPVTLRVTSGGPPLTWKVSANADWVHLQPTSGAAPGTFKVSVSTKDLKPGSYASMVTVTMEGAPNGPVQVPVDLMVK